MGTVGATASARTAILSFADGHVETVEVPSGTMVLDAAAEAGLGLASQCRSGSCGTCVAQLRSGETSAAPGRALALLDSEYRAGTRLLCSTLLESAAEFELPYPSDVLFGEQPKTCAATVTELEPVAPSVVRLRLRPATGPMNYRPGQYTRIHVPGTQEWRSFSMANLPGEPELELHVRLLPDGLFSGFLREVCKVGDEVEIEGPFGTFAWRPSRDHQLFVAGGTGLAPLLAMIDGVRELGDRRTPITLCFACQTENELYYTDEIELREMWMPKLKGRVAVTAPIDEAAWTGRVGTPVSLIDPGEVDENTTAYLCGPPGMIRAAADLLLELGVPLEQIHSERFVASED